MGANQIMLLAEDIADTLLELEEKNSLSSAQADIIAIELDKLFLKYIITNDGDIKDRRIISCTNLV